MTRQRHIRPEDRLDDRDTVVIRGGRLDVDGLRADAERHFRVYGSYGISVFAARGISVDELARRVPLVRFGMLTLIRVGVLRSAGLRLDPTGRDPKHFTVAFDDLDTGVRALMACERRAFPNPYHDG